MVPFFPVSNWILTHTRTQCFGRKRKKLRKKEEKNQQIGEGEKSEHINVLYSTFATLGV